MTLLPERAGGGRRLVVEDTGRWYAGDDGRPARACGVVRVINDRAEREQRLAFLSRYDELTGFFNRNHLIAALGEALANAKRLRTSMAFVIVAVDNFRAINEAYDFDTADQVFAAVGAPHQGGAARGRRHRPLLGQQARHRADELRRERHARRRRAVSCRRAPRDRRHRDQRRRGHDIDRAVSACRATDARCSEALARAQEGLHRARKRGHDHFVAFTPSPGREARQRSNAALSSELVAALNEKRLRLAFQPVVDIATRKPVFHEGLLRLERADGTSATAADFVELSERLGLIRLIDQLRSGRARWRRWRRPRTRAFRSTCPRRRSAMRAWLSSARRRDGRDGPISPAG